MPNKYPHIVITSINPPTEAVLAYAKLNQFQTIVVGDTKSPRNWHCDKVDYIPMEKQSTMGFECEKYLPTEHYCRKNIGYLKAIRNGAELIVDTDDDNIPYENYAHPPFSGRFSTPNLDNQWINAYQYFTDIDCWPRGFPLDKVKNQMPALTHANFKISVWQGLADKEPDLDAIYRLTKNNYEDIIFAKNEPLALTSTQLCPTNSQNTTFASEAFPLLYLPHTVTFRFTDILRGLIMQTLLGLEGSCIGFHAATVYQKRNTHDLMQDFESEIPCYLWSEQIPKILNSALSKNNSLADNLFNSYKILAEKNIVKNSELPCVEAWLKDLVHIKTK